MRSTLPPALRRAVRNALLPAHEAAGDELRRHGFVRFVEADPADYDQ